MQMLLHKPHLQQPVIRPSGLELHFPGLESWLSIRCEEREGFTAKSYYPSAVRKNVLSKYIYCQLGGIRCQSGLIFGKLREKRGLSVVLRTWSFASEAYITAIEHAKQPLHVDLYTLVTFNITIFLLSTLMGKEITTN